MNRISSPCNIRSMNSLPIRVYCSNLTDFARYQAEQITLSFWRWVGERGIKRINILHGQKKFNGFDIENQARNPQNSLLFEQNFNKVRKLCELSIYGIK